jgi:hypothetical protein
MKTQIKVDEQTGHDPPKPGITGAENRLLKQRLFGVNGDLWCQKCYQREGTLRLMQSVTGWRCWSCGLVKSQESGLQVHPR